MTTPDPITPERVTACGTCFTSGWYGSREGSEHRHCDCGRPCRACTPERVTLTEAEHDELAGSLSWHFRCHAAEPDKSYASLGIQNAVGIAERILADRLRAAQADAWDQGWDERDNDCGDPYSPHRTNPYRGHDD